MTRFYKNIIRAALLISLLFSYSNLFAEKITDRDFGFSLDIPEGFEIADYTQDGMSYIFSHPNIPVTLVMKITQESQAKSAAEVLKKNLNKLSAKGDTDSFNWNGSECGISSFTMTLDDNYFGWSVSAPVKIKGYYVVLLCYAPESKKACEQFIISTVNSLCINDEYLNRPGIITSYAFPPEGRKALSLQIGGKQIKTSLDKVDEEAAKFVIDLEYAVLNLYANHKMWKEAWQRYYRMIYRDNAGRLQQTAADIYKALYPELKKSDPQTADIKYAQALLSWVQGFGYERAKSKNESDFTSLPAAISGKGSDCDSRSMLISALLNYTGIDTALLISREYSHAMVVTDIPAPGQTFTMEDGREYLMGETTAHVTWGTIAANHADRTKWMCVSFDE
ncbi:hypothetical protein [Treponema bryantii]|uniref:hypothetical protein n=1 Tax=Treponema bryantii TaxID=163 RepID=UPI0003B6D5C4|nr:hypothetical protein [Treponema bryantii]